MIEHTRGIDRSAFAVLWIGIAFITAPIAIAFVTASLSYTQFITSGGFGMTYGNSFWENINRIMTETLLPRQLVNSFAVASLVAFLKCALAFTATFALVFYQSRLNTFIFALTLVTIIIPVELIVVTTYQIVANVAEPLNWLLAGTGLGTLLEKVTGTRPYFEWNLLDSYFGVAAPLATASTSVFIYRQFFLTLPKDLVRAATMDGAGPLRFMFDVVLPLSWTPIVATFMFWFIGGWTSFLWPLLASSTPETQVAIVGLTNMSKVADGQIPDVPLLMAGALFVSFIPVLLIALMQRKIIQGLNLSEK